MFRVQTVFVDPQGNFRKVTEAVGGRYNFLRLCSGTALNILDVVHDHAAAQVSHQLWDHVTGQFRVWERAPQPPKHIQDMLPAEFSKEQYAEARRHVRTYNRSIARAIQTDDEKALVGASQELEGWSEGVTENRDIWGQAVWHAAHETERLGATASAAFHAFRPELLAQLHTPQPRPMSEIVILGAQHDHNLGQGATAYDHPRTVRLQVLLEDYTDTYGRTERRLAAYELADNNRPTQRLGYLPKDAPRRVGNYLATLQRPAGKKRIQGTLSPLKSESQLPEYGKEADA